MWAYWHIRGRKEGNNRRYGEIWRAGEKRRGRRQSSWRPHLLLSQRKENNISTHSSSLRPSLKLSHSASLYNTKDVTWRRRCWTWWQRWRVCGTGLNGVWMSVCRSPGVPVAFNQMEFGPTGRHGYGCVRCLLTQWTAASKQTSSCLQSTLSVAQRVQQL